MSGQTIREFLTQREQELAEEVRIIRLDLAPKEVELRDIRRAMLALDGKLVERRRPPDRGRETIKDQCLFVLRAALGGRGSSNEIQYAIAAEFGHTIVRTSLAPQLSRLARDGEIEHGPGNMWSLVDNNRATTNGGGSA